MGHPETKEENSLQRAELCVQATTGLPWLGSSHGSWQLSAAWTFALFCPLQFHQRHKLTPVGLLKGLTCSLSEPGSQRGETEDRGLVSLRPPEERTLGKQAVFPPGFRALLLRTVKALDVWMHLHVPRTRRECGMWLLNGDQR